MMRVAAYCRVSTDKTDQMHSFNSQKAFFSHYIDNKPDWLLTEIYADEGVTGTTTTARTGFLKMLDDAASGAFDIIVTKEVSRFSRNILDAISITRKLKELSIGVIFLNDGISTLDPDAELRLGIMASVAQEESRRTSERVRWGQQRQMEKGVVFGRSLLGYDVKNGSMTIDAEGAAIVRRIFSMYLNDRLGVRAIAQALTESGARTKSGGITWSGAAVLKIIRNEKYCGDLLQKKTVTTDFLTHKKKRNRGDDLVYIRDHHAPIVGREVWEAAQSEMKRRAHNSAKKESCGNRYALSGRIICGGCGAAYYCRTIKRKRGGIYRLWNCTRCSCAEKNKQIHEETLVLCVRHILKSYDQDALTMELGNITTKLFQAHPTAGRDCERKQVLMREKLIRLTDLYIEGEIKGEAYAVLKARYDTELEGLVLFHRNLQFVEPEKHAAAAIQTIASLASGEADDTDFYLSLIERIDIISKSQIDIILVDSTGKWSIEIT